MSELPICDIINPVRAKRPNTKGMIKAMTVQITAKKMQLSPAFNDYATERLSAKLDKFFGSEASSKLILTSVKNKISLELTVVLTA